MAQTVIQDLNERSRTVFKELVEAYLETGQPIGSRTLSRRLDLNLSAASIRNVMADLEDIGLLFAPHTSAGRLPTDAGLRLFVEGLLEIGDLTEEERREIEARCAPNGRSLQELLSQATEMLSGLSNCAGLVMAPKLNAPLEHIEFVRVGHDKAMVIMVTESGMVENRLIELPVGLTPSALVEASNYLNHHLKGRTLEEVRAEIQRELDEHRAALDALTSKVVEEGIADLGGKDENLLIVRGRANLMEDVHAIEELEEIRALFKELESRRDQIQLLDLTQGADGVRIFIGSENTLFSRSGSSMVVAPFHNSQQRLVGCIGVIGPTRLNYGRIIPMVDYTAQVLERLIGKQAA